MKDLSFSVELLKQFLEDMEAYSHVREESKEGRVPCEGGEGRGVGRLCMCVWWH